MPPRWDTPNLRVKIVRQTQPKRGGFDVSALNYVDGANAFEMSEFLLLLFTTEFWIRKSATAPIA